MQESGIVHIPLNHGYETIVDAIDGDLSAFKWTAVVSKYGNVYAQRTVRLNGKKSNLGIHRVILARIMQVEVPQGHEYECDHVDGNSLNNLRENLRPATSAQNKQNRKLMSSNTSGVTGVSWSASQQKWWAVIYINRKQVWLGSFTEFTDAVAARYEAEVKYFGEFSPLSSRNNLTSETSE